MRRHLWPLGLFLLLLGVLAAGLRLDPRALPSPLVDRPAPAFSLPQVHHPEQRLALADLRGQVWLLNVWASWCVACRNEHPLLVDFARSAGVPLYGLNYKDQREDAVRWLDRFGNPYRASLSDTQGLVGLDYGVYGVPETFVIDQQGVIRYKQTGPLTPELLAQTILPLVRRLRG